MNVDSITTMSKELFIQNRQDKCGFSMENNRHLAKVRVWFGHITWVHIHAKFKEDLLHASAVFSKTVSEQSGMLHQDYQ